MTESPSSPVMKFSKIFVTVGTTEFNELIKQLASSEAHKTLKNSLGCEQLTLQIGKGEEVDFSHFRDIKVEIFSLKPSITDEIQAADLVISHAGAGSCLDALTQGKRLLVVVNDTLMDNHQTELAEQLASDGYLFYTTVKELPEALRKSDFSKLKPYEEGNIGKFVDFLETNMGFS